MPYSYPKYPGAIFDDTDFPDQTDHTNWIKAWLTNALKEELQACLTELGTNPKGEYDSVKERLDAAIETFLNLTDTPNDYTDQAGKAVIVNEGEDGLEFGEAGGAGVPSGGIIIWTGTIANIPDGFVICDGNNSSPNLLTKFIQGVTTAGTDPGATGGEATHTLSIAELASHTHEQQYVLTGTSYPNRMTTPSFARNNPGGAGNVLTVSAGSGSAHQNEPTYFDVAYIMKT